MTLRESCEAAAADLLAAAPRLVETQAQTTLALVTLRVQNDGLAGARYTDKSVPRFFFATKAFNAGGRAYAKKKGKGTYSGFKKALGLPGDRVTLTFTGRMFRSLTTLYTGFSGGVYTAAIVAADQESAAKVAYNMGRYGDFLEPTPDELAQVNEVTSREITRILQRHFPGR